MKHDQPRLHQITVRVRHEHICLSKVRENAPAEGGDGAKREQAKDGQLPSRRSGFHEVRAESCGTGDRRAWRNLPQPCTNGKKIDGLEKSGGGELDRLK
jgi:hypothetical protein